MAAIEYVPFSFVEANDTPLRLGGPAPVINTQIDYAKFAYFGTFPILGARDRVFSVFVARDYDGLFDWMSSVHTTAESPIQCAVHRPDSSRERDPARAATFAEVAFALGDPTPESEERLDRVFAGHKLGGRPYAQWGSQWASLEAIQARGLDQLVQVSDFYDGDVAEPGDDWPFHTGVFHVFGRAKLPSDEWAWYWECS